MTKVARLVALSQFSFFACLGVCFIILPGFLLERNEGGVSNYGVHRQTVVPYTLAFLLSSIFLAKAAFLLPRVHRYWRAALLAVAGSQLLVLGSTYPYKLNGVFQKIHIFFGIELFCLEIVLAFWLALVVLRDRQSVALLAVQLAGFLLATLTFAGVLHLLFVAQMVTTLAFGLQLWRVAKHVPVSSITRP